MVWHGIRRIFNKALFAIYKDNRWLQSALGGFFFTTGRVASVSTTLSVLATIFLDYHIPALIYTGTKKPSVAKRDKIIVYRKNIMIAFLRRLVGWKSLVKTTGPRLTLPHWKTVIVWSCTAASLAVHSTS